MLGQMMGPVWAWEMGSRYCFQSEQMVQPCSMCKGDHAQPTRGFDRAPNNAFINPDVVSDRRCLPAGAPLHSMAKPPNY